MDQIAGDLDPLLHTARIGPWLVIDTAKIELNTVKPVERRLTHVPIVATTKVHQRLCNIGPARYPHAKSVTWVLMNKAPVFTLHAAPIRF